MDIPDLIFLALFITLSWTADWQRTANGVLATYNVCGYLVGHYYSYLFDDTCSG
jgi:hypothetical protein